MRSHTHTQGIPKLTDVYTVHTFYFQAFQLDWGSHIYILKAYFHACMIIFMRNYVYTSFLVYLLRHAYVSTGCSFTDSGILLKNCDLSTHAYYFAIYMIFKRSFYSVFKGNQALIASIIFLQCRCHVKIIDFEYLLSTMCTSVCCMH